MAENTQIAEKKEFTTNLSQWVNEITDLISRDYQACGVEFSEYSKLCAMEAMTSIYNLIKTNPKVNMQNLDTSNLRWIVERCASLKLNANAYPRECYFQLRNVKVGVDEKGKDVWQQMVEMGIEGAGNDSLLRNYGVDVEKVYPYWVIKEGDGYNPPVHKGIEIIPPEWEEKGLSQKAIRVVYPVKLKDGTVTYLIAERESVKTNLLAHVKQNMQNETFGLVKGGKQTRYDATPKELEDIKAKKEEILNAMRKCDTVDEMIQCDVARPYMSGAWLDTPESMIVRKMCNNATKKHPKNYDPMARKAYMEMDETYQQVQETIADNANKEDFIDETNIINGTAREVEKTSSETQLPPFMQAE